MSSKGVVNSVWFVHVVFHETNQFILSLLILMCMPSFEFLNSVKRIGNFLPSCDVVCTQWHVCDHGNSG
jgi:hypothetical protein